MEDCGHPIHFLRRHSLEDARRDRLGIKRQQVGRRSRAQSAQFVAATLLALRSGHGDCADRFAAHGGSLFVTDRASRKPKQVSSQAAMPPDKNCLLRRGVECSPTAPISTPAASAIVAAA
jgi:hypothetical protein